MEKDNPANILPITGIAVLQQSQADTVWLPIAGITSHTARRRVGAYLCRPGIFSDHSPAMVETAVAGPDDLTVGVGLPFSLPPRVVVVIPLTGSGQ